VTKAERHLAENPSDGAGWDLLGPIYLRMQRPGDAELAYRNAIRLIGPTSARLTGLGEALVTMSDGVITEDARTAFEGALKLEPGDTRARFYVALGLEQAGKAPEAKAAFEEIAKNSPADAPWMPLLNQHIAKNGGAPLATAPPTAASGAGRAPGGPSQDDVAAAENLSQGDRQTMIRGMVDSLAARLKDEPNNLDGWLRLVRSYAVLGEKDKAGEALNQGLAQFSADTNGKNQLLALAGEMGLTAQAQKPAEGAKQ
jgi:cytochrome c-type biogenesis protein CcmH